MKECKEEVLIPLMKILKNQEYCECILKKDVEDSHLVLYRVFRYKCLDLFIPHTRTFFGFYCYMQILLRVLF